MFYYRWCILNPLRQIKSENTDQELEKERYKFYSKIQQLLMEAVLRLKSSNGNKHAISAQHLAQTIRDLMSLLDRASADGNQSGWNLVMERLAQAVSTALSVNCIYGNKRKTFFFYLFLIFFIHLFFRKKFNFFFVFLCRGIVGTFTTTCK